MGTWYDLPPEIHDHILQFFCIDIIDDYIDAFPPKDPSLLYYNGHPRRADTPESLKNFSSALQTCRSFFNSIVHHINVEGVPAVQTLQDFQRLKILLLISRGGDRPWPIQFFTAWAGVFWKNPAICNDLEFMVKVMSSLAYESLALLLPHLEEWVNAFQSRISEGERGMLNCALIFEGDSSLDAHQAVFRAGSYDFQLHQGLFDHYAIRSVSGLYEGCEFKKDREMQLRFPNSGRYSTTDRGFASLQAKMNKNLIDRFPIFRDIHNSEPDTWWLFVMQVDRWYLVDYKGKRMWGSKCEPIPCYWDDMWDSKSWKLGLDRSELGPDWFLFPDLAAPPNSKS
jgi:hypothetical protein